MGQILAKWWWSILKRRHTHTIFVVVFAVVGGDGGPVDAMNLLYPADAKFHLGPFTTNTTSQLNVLWHDGDPLSVDGAQICIFEKTNQVCFRSFLQSSNSCRLESQVSFEILCNFTNQSLEGQFSNKQLSGLLVSPNFTESYCTRPVPVWLFHTSSWWCRFSSCLGGQLLPGSLTTGGFSCSLLGTGHNSNWICNECRFKRWAIDLNLKMWRSSHGGCNCKVC